MFGVSHVEGERIAIVGRGGVFPGAADLAGFWRNISEGVDAGRPVPDDRWFLKPRRAVAPGGPQADRVYSAWSCTLDSVPDVPSSLAVDAAELQGLDPLFRIGLAAASQAWNDAQTRTLGSQRVGVILGHIVLPTESTSALSRDVLLRAFAERLLNRPIADWPQSHWDGRNWSAAGLPAVLIARALQLGGTAFTLDAACASSLYAIKLACDELRSGRADAMLAGGLSRPDCQYTQMGFAQLQALSKRGRCAPLSDAADGLVVGEGAGIFVLKRLSDALRDGDRIYATIAGIGLSNDRGANLLAPRSEGQLRAMRAAYAQAGWTPGMVDLIECHATGTPIGDGVELDSLHDLWREESEAKQRCVLGSVKSNVGHLLTAAGGASVMKTLFALETATLPPTANFERPAAGLARNGSPFQVLREAIPWERRSTDKPRRAAINAFGFGGINAHVLLEEWNDHNAGNVERDFEKVARTLGDFRDTGRTLEPVAIVGLAAHFGPWQGLRAVQEHFFGSGQAYEPQPPYGCGLDIPSNSLSLRPQTSALSQSGYSINEVRIPLAEFRIPPLELEEMLPQQQLMLQVAADALDDAGCPRELGDRTGVFVGIGLDPNTTNFHCRWAIEEFADDWARELGLTLSAEERTTWIAKLRDAFGPPLTANRVMGNLGGIVASRLAREFDVGGPCFTISSDETSGIHALQTAVRALQRGELDRALVGAIDLPGDIRQLLTRSPGMAIPGSPFCDGVTAFVLKRREDAQRDGDRIYAVISEQAANVSEISKLCSADIVSSVGHCGAATGLAAVLKGTLALYHQLTPLQGEHTTPSFWLCDRTTGPRELRIGCVGGDNIVLKEATCQSPQVEIDRRQPLGEFPISLFVLDGDTTDDIRAAATELLAAVNDRQSVEALARRWFRLRPPEARRRFAVVVTAANPSELRDRLSALLSPNSPPLTPSLDREGEEKNVVDGIYFAPRPLFPDGRLAFVFPGSGSHFLGMGRELLAAWPEVLAAQGTHTQRLRSQFHPELVWNGPSTEAIGRDHKAMIFAQVALGTAICDWLALFGVRPQASIGYSLGESAALFGLRAWSDRDEMLRRMEASPLFGSDLVHPFDAARAAWKIPPSQDVPWLSGVIDRSADRVRSVLEMFEDVYLLIVNTPTQCVIGGRRTQVEKLVRELEANFIPLPAPSTVHCPILQQVAQAYTELHLMETTQPEGIEFYSSASGQPYDLSREAAAGAIRAQATATVDFPRVIESAFANGVRVFIEIGPGSSCTKMIGEILGDRPHVARAVCPATAHPVRHALQVLAELITHRVPVDLTALYGRESALPSHQAPLPEQKCVVTRVAAPSFPSTAELQRLAPRATKARQLLPQSATISNRDPAPAPLPLAPATRSKPAVGSAPAVSALAPTSTAAAARDATGDPLVAAWDEWMTERIAAHETFLRFSQSVQEVAAQVVRGGTVALRETAREQRLRLRDSATPAPPQSRAPAPPTTPPRSLDYDQCLQFAIGKIGDVLGPAFAEIDQFPTRVRLPDVPLMLVDRILEVEGEPLSMTHGRVVTEHDIHADDWYLDCGRIPTCLAVESGQADLFLSGWLGIDLQTRGLACYRLLDAVVTFHDALPGPGKIIRYDIRIDRFFRQGETYLFRFEFDATVDGQPLMTMRDGCAGFFTAQELAAGQGVVHTALDKQPRPGIRPDDWSDPVPMMPASYTDEQLDALRSGDLAACFGPAFADLPLRRPVTLPSDRLRLVHRVLSLEPGAGKYGLGQIRGEADIDPHDWFLVCHFCDDQVMPGTLMYECCLHTLRIYLLRMGWIGEEGQVAYEPVPGVKSRLKCRGQVTATTQKVCYEITLKELGYGSPGIAIPGSSLIDGAPYCLADALMYADGKPIVEITDMSVRLSGLTRAHIERLWASAADTHGMRPVGFAPLFDRERITEFAIGKPSKAFGDRYRVFDEERVIARLPGPPFQFLDRITKIEHCEPWKLAAGGVIEAQYDVPPDAWYFASNRQQRMPFAVLLETALQPCGWLAAYLGSALTSDVDLSFRNLGGKATQFEDVLPTSGTLTTTVKIARVSQSAGMIIQNYEFDLRCDNRPVYQGTTYFGFFSKAALGNQVGIRDAAIYQPSADELARATAFEVPVAPPFPDERFRMVRNVDAFVPDGGPLGLGYIRGSVNVDPDAWFFKAHFYQDPVWPGSLGLESFLQLMKLYAMERWGGVGWDKSSSPTNPNAKTLVGLADSSHPTEFAAVALHQPHEWVYRGQVIPRDKTVTVDAVITAVNDERRLATASGFLTVDGRVIYRMIDFTVQMVSSV